MKNDKGDRRKKTGGTRDRKCKRTAFRKKQSELGSLCKSKSDGKIETWRERSKKEIAEVGKKTLLRLFLREIRRKIARNAISQSLNIKLLLRLAECIESGEIQTTQ